MYVSMCVQVIGGAFKLTRLRGRVPTGWNTSGGNESGFMGMCKPRQLHIPMNRSTTHNVGRLRCFCRRCLETAKARRLRSTFLSESLSIASHTVVSLVCFLLAINGPCCRCFLLPPLSAPFFRCESLRSPRLPCCLCRGQS